jgi:hypothetical protein
MVHPLSQAEADRVFSKEDREESAKRLQPQYRNARQRFDRNMKKCDRLLADFDKRIGTIWDLAEREIYAERAQINAMEMHALEALMRGLFA